MKIMLEAENRQDMLAAMRYIGVQDTFPATIRVPVRGEECVLIEWLNSTNAFKSGPVIKTRDVKLTKVAT